MTKIDKRSILEDSCFPCVVRLRTKSDVMRNIVIDNIGCFSIVCNTNCWMSCCFEI